MDPEEYASHTFPCPGEAHDPQVAGRIDNCGLCAPDWGKIPAHRALSCDARFVLLAIDALEDSPFLHMPPHDAFDELQRMGLAESVMVRETKGAKPYRNVSSFFVPRLTAFGRAAVEAIKEARKGKRIKRELVSEAG